MCMINLSHYTKWTSHILRKPLFTLLHKKKLFAKQKHFATLTRTIFIYSPKTIDKIDQDRWHTYRDKRINLNPPAQSIHLSVKKSFLSSNKLEDGRKRKIHRQRWIIEIGNGIFGKPTKIDILRTGLQPLVK